METKLRALAVQIVRHPINFFCPNPFRISSLEIFDEVEEWQLLANHYCVAWACHVRGSGSKADGAASESSASATTLIEDGPNNQTLVTLLSESVSGISKFSTSRT